MLNRERFKDADWFNDANVDVLIGGAGGTGSWLALLLTRLGSRVVIYDFDSIESHNLGGQLYPMKDIGKQKVDSLKQTIKDFCNEEILVFNEMITSETMTNKFVFSCFDNMKARKEMFDAWIEGNKGDSTALFTDLRLIMEQASIFCVKNTPEDIEKYRANLFDDSEVPDAPCTARQTSHAASLIASHAVGYFVNHLTNIKGKSSRFVPFFWELFMPLDAISYQSEG